MLGQRLDDAGAEARLGVRILGCRFGVAHGRVSRPPTGNDADLAFRWRGKACFSELMTSSVTIRPRLTEASAFIWLSSTLTFSVSWSWSLIIEAPMLAHRSVK